MATRILAAALCALSLSAWNFQAHAQVNTSGLRGAVTAPDGSILANAQVVLVHEPSQNVKSARTNTDGEFAFTGLRVGGETGNQQR